MSLLHCLVQIAVPSESNSTTSDSESEVSRGNRGSTSSEDDAIGVDANPLAPDKPAQIPHENLNKVSNSEISDMPASEIISTHSKSKKRRKLSKHEADEPETHEMDNAGLEFGEDEEKNNPNIDDEEYVNAMKNAKLLSDSDVEMQTDNIKIPRRTLQLLSSDDDDEN